MKTVLITGTNGGIGFALAKKFLHEGYKVLATTRSGTLDELFDTNLVVIKLDISKQEEIDLAAAVIKFNTKSIDVLINNAGVGLDFSNPKPIRNILKETLDINLMGLIFFTEAVLDLVVEGGEVINVSSGMGLLQNAKATAPAYRISKAAVNMYSKILADRLKNKNIRVLAIHPGWVITKMGGVGASLTTEESANRIYKCLSTKISSGSFYDADQGIEIKM